MKSPPSSTIHAQVEHEAKSNFVRDWLRPYLRQTRFCVYDQPQYGLLSLEVLCIASRNDAHYRLGRAVRKRLCKGDVMGELDENAQQLRETFARYGLAMYHAQCVEKSLAILVSIVFNIEFLHNPDRRDEIQDEVFSKTIGKLLIRMKKQISVPPNLDLALEEAREKRNWLAHEYFWERAGELLTTRGRNQLIDELESLSGFFAKIDARLVSIYDKWSKRVGIPQEVFDEELNKMIRENE